MNKSITIICCTYFFGGPQHCSQAWYAAVVQQRGKDETTRTSCSVCYYVWTTGRISYALDWVVGHRRIYHLGRKITQGMIRIVDQNKIPSLMSCSLCSLALLGADSQYTNKGSDDNCTRLLRLFSILAL